MRGLGDNLEDASAITAQVSECNICTLAVSNISLEFCNNFSLHNKILSAYDRLWDLIEANKAQLSSEVWSWNYDDGYRATPLGTFIPTESNIRQLWSLTFLAVKRENFGLTSNGTSDNCTYSER